MKNYVVWALTLLLIFSMVGCAEKEKASILTLEELPHLSEEQLSEKLVGISHEVLKSAWAEPDGHGSGFWLDFWHLDDENTIAIYYDTGGNVETVKITDIHFNKTDRVDDSNGNSEAAGEVSDEKDSFFLNVSSVKKITVELFRMGQTTEWELKADELSDWVTWAKGLSGNIVSDGKVAELQMTDGGESYHFTDGDQLSFSYVLNGSKRYVVIDSIWYEIANPTDPF